MAGLRGNTPLGTTAAVLQPAVVGATPLQVRTAAVGHVRNRTRCSRLRLLVQRRDALEQPRAGAERERYTAHGYLFSREWRTSRRVRRGRRSRRVSGRVRWPAGRPRRRRCDARVWRVRGRGRRASGAGGPGRVRRRGLRGGRGRPVGPHARRSRWPG